MSQEIIECCCYFLWYSSNISFTWYINMYTKTFFSTSFRSFTKFSFASCKFLGLFFISWVFINISVKMASANSDSDHKEIYCLLQGSLEECDLRFAWWINNVIKDLGSQTLKNLWFPNKRSWGVRGALRVWDGNAVKFGYDDCYTPINVIKFIK